MLDTGLDLVHPDWRLSRALRVIESGPRRDEREPRQWTRAMYFSKFLRRPGDRSRCGRRDHFALSARSRDLHCARVRQRQQQKNRRIGAIGSGVWDRPGLWRAHTRCCGSSERLGHRKGRAHDQHLLWLLGPDARGQASPERGPRITRSLCLQPCPIMATKRAPAWPAKDLGPDVKTRLFGKRRHLAWTPRAWLRYCMR